MKKSKKNNIGERIATGGDFKRRLLGPGVLTEFDREAILRKMKKAKKQK
jgi:hypothetical protein